MGVLNLIKLIERYAPQSIKYKKITDYKNKKLGIDANLMIYKIIFAIRRGGYDIENNGTVVTHIHGLLQKIMGFRKYDITPVFVFDSSFPDIKEETLRKRKEIRQTFKKKYAEALKDDMQDYKKKYFYLKSDITEKEINDIRELIKIFGYQIIDSKEEADSELANMMAHNLIDGIITDDMDILLFGGKKILRRFTVSDKKKIQEIDLKKFLKQAKLSQKQLVDIGIMIGCDYCASVKGIGPIKAYKLIQDYKSIDVLRKKANIKFEFDHKKIRDYFMNPPITKIDKINIKKYKESKLDMYKLSKYLEKHKYKLTDINNILKKLDS
jgi:flap endonuclease-1